MPRGKKKLSDSEEGSDSDHGGESSSVAPEDDGGEYGSRNAKKGKKAAAKKKAAANAKPSKPTAPKKAKAAAKIAAPAAADPAPIPAAAVPAVASGVPTPTDEAIQKNAGMASFLRGSEYYESKKLSPTNITVSGNTISAKIKGVEEYNIEATITAPDSWTCKCSCPMGVENKQCKHIACLLFAFQELQTGIKKERGKRNPSVQAKVDFEAEKLDGLSAPDLKAILKANNQSQTGTKADLIDRAAYCAAFGALPRCPKCSGGKLKERGTYIVCPGYMDDDIFRDCDFFTEKIDHVPFRKS